MRTLFTLLILFGSQILLNAEGGILGAFSGEESEFVCYPSVHRNFFLAIFGLVVLAGVFAWSRFRLKSRTARELEQKNKLIEEQNKDILDSIRYASRLQKALEPVDSVRTEILPESFVYLKPRNIVSGDFYFIHECEGKKIVAAIDCTGHGVPGAFLTFIGHNALRSALEKSKSLNPSQLLDLMNREVKITLGQNRDASELNDGMEIGLCVFDPQTRVLEYAGAGTPLYIVKGGLLEEVKAAKCTVGSIQTHITAPPISHQVQLNEGDSFFLASDGIADQFGGPDGKKFQKERLRKMLSEIGTGDFAGAAKHVDAILQQWKGAAEQTDDMLLIGVKVA